MILHQPLLAVVSVLALAGCATASAASSVPSDREVAAFVASNWDHYEARFAFLSERRGQSSTMLSVTRVECVPDEGDDAKCSFFVSGRFVDGAVVSQPMESFFRRQPDGSIEVLIPVAYR